MSLQRKIYRNIIRKKYGNKAVRNIWHNIKEIRLKEIYNELYGEDNSLWKRALKKLEKLAKNIRKKKPRKSKSK